MRDALDQHENLYLLSYENMRSSKFKNVRVFFRDDDSRIFLGKNKLLQIALGRTEEDEYAENLRHVSKRINGGNVGLLLTSRPCAAVEEYFSSLVEADFARAGTCASRAEFITAKMLEDFPVSMMEQFRKLGMPVEIKNGKILLRDKMERFLVCSEGEILTAEKCKLLLHFGIKLADFRVKPVCRWSKGEFEVLA